MLCSASFSVNNNFAVIFFKKKNQIIHVFCKSEKVLGISCMVTNMTVLTSKCEKVVIKEHGLWHHTD